MNKFTNILAGVLLAIICYFYTSFRLFSWLSWPGDSIFGPWGPSGPYFYILVAVIFVGLFVVGKFFKKRILGNILSILAYAILSFILFSMLIAPILGFE